MDVSRLEIPDRHLTRRGEDEWEKELGDTGERTAARESARERLDAAAAATGFTRGLTRGLLTCLYK